MKFRFKELGVIRQAELTLGDLTVVCGKNNTGKTYITYAIYGLLDLWRRANPITLPDNFVRNLIGNGVATLPLGRFEKDHKGILRRFSSQYSRNVHKVFAGDEALFASADIDVEVGAIDGKHAEYKKLFAAANYIFEVRKTASEEGILLNLLTDRFGEERTDKGNKEHVGKEGKNSRLTAAVEEAVGDVIGRVVREALFDNQFPKPFIASAERTGSAIFQKELDFTRNRLVDLLKDKANEDISHQLLGHFSAEYPLPVKRNVDFTRALSNLKRKSVLSKEQPHLIQQFEKIAGGSYSVTKEGDVQYTPSDKRGVKLAMAESSSAVRSLSDIGFYLQHLARPGDILMVDEPELNLHPENQRLIARLFAMLINCGIKVFVTTHSDYIVRELNTLMALNKPDVGRLAEIAKREGYQRNELISSEQVRVYIAQDADVRLDGKRKKAECPTLVEVNFDDDTGISLVSFDNAIEEMNRIQDEIVWGE